MQFGMIGLGRMGGDMTRRLLRKGHAAVVYDRDPKLVAALVSEGATPAATLVDLLAQLQAPRSICLMVPAAKVESLLTELSPLLSAGDTLIDGGNSNFQDDIVRARQLAGQGVHFLDMGTSGGVWGLERGYCLMLGGDAAAVQRLEPLLRDLAPGVGNIPHTPGREVGGGPSSTAEHGYLHCGASGAGHFVKMIHNGIEYGMMAAMAEGLNILKSANRGKHVAGEADAETTPLRNPEHYQYDFDVADITELWRRGSVVTSWLLDLTAQALASDPQLAAFGGSVSDSGEGRWTVATANDLGVPAHVLTAALYERFASRGLDLFQNKALSAMRFGFGGHLEKKH